MGDAEQEKPGSGRVQWGTEIKGPYRGGPDERQLENVEQATAAAKKGMSQFLEFFHQELLPELPSRRDLSIAVVSHGSLIALALRPAKDEGICKNSLEWGPKDQVEMENIQIMAVEYLIAADGLIPISCTRAYNGSPKPKDICAADFASCQLEGASLEMDTGTCICGPGVERTLA